MRMRFTIGTVSSNLEFEETMRLIKSSLLYADEVELIGMIEYAVFCYIPNHIYNTKEIGELLKGISLLLKSIGAEGSKEILSQINGISAQLEELSPILKKKKNRTTQEILAQMQMEKAFKESKKTLLEGIETVLNTPGSMAIKALLNQKIISVHDYGSAQLCLDEMVGGYFANLLNSMRAHTSFPLFDKVSEGVIRSVVDTPFLDFGNTNPEVLRHAGVASNILMTLPTLEGASIDEILDFKKDNERSLIGFRQAIFKFSEAISSLPWDDDFQFECYKLYNTEVAPKVAELNTLSSDASVIRNLGKRAVADAEIRKAAGFAVGGIAATILSQTSLMEAMVALRDIILGVSLLAVSPQIANGFLKTIDLVNQSKDEVKKISRELQGNTMYYYYKASKDL